MQSRLVTVILVAVYFTIGLLGCAKNSSSDPSLTPTYNASIYIGGDNHIVYAIDPVTGLKNWEYSCAAPIKASPLVYNERVYIGTSGAGSGQDTLYKLNAATGELIKKIVVLPTAFYQIIATPTADANLIYLACTNGILYAIDTGNYNVVWSFSTAPGAIRSSPVVYNGYVYFGCDDGNVYCIDKTNGPTGAYNWSWNPYPVISSQSITWGSSPAIGYGYLNGRIDTMLCIGGADSMYCIQLTNVIPRTPTFRWAFKTGDAIASSPTIYGGACVFGSDDDYVYCVDLESGGQRWKRQTSSRVTSSPYALNNTIYVGSDDYNLYALKFWDGTIKWTHATMGMIKSSPIRYGKSVYVASYDKNLYSIDTLTGQKQWSFFVNNTIDCSPAIDNNTGGTGVNSSISGFTN